MMRKILLCLALVLSASPVWAQVSLVSGQTNTTAVDTLWVAGSFDETLAFPGAVTSGNTVVAWTQFADSRRTMTCTHDGNAMTALTVRGATSANGDQIELIFARVATTTGTSVTCTISGADNNGYQQFTIAEFAGLAATLSTSGGAGVSTVTAVETSAATSHDTGADLTPDTTDNLFLSALGCTSDPGAVGADGHTMLVNGGTFGNYHVGYRIQSAATAQDWVPTSANSVGCEVVTVNLDGAAGGGGSSPRRLTLLGVGGI